MIFFVVANVILAAHTYCFAMVRIHSSGCACACGGRAVCFRQRGFCVCMFACVCICACRVCACAFVWSDRATERTKYRAIERSVDRQFSYRATEHPCFFVKEINYLFANMVICSSTCRCICPVLSQAEAFILNVRQTVVMADPVTFTPLENANSRRDLNEVIGLLIALTHRIPPYQRYRIEVLIRALQDIVNILNRPAWAPDEPDSSESDSTEDESHEIITRVESA